VPHSALADANAVYQAWQIGRVQFVATDVRYNRSPNADPDGPSKTMLGATQKTWLAGVLAASTAQVLVWFMASQWLGGSTDGWASFATERDELVELLDEHGWLGRMVMVQGDRHALGLTGGATNNWGGFPVLQAASMDSSFGTPIPDVFDVGDDTPGRNQYGTVAVTDLGSAITLELTGWQGTTEWASYSFGASVAQAPTATASDIADVISGSHRPTFEARLLPAFQTGDSPTGTILHITGGDVQLDGTAQIRGTLQLETPGIDEAIGRSTFPRQPADPLAPLGAEIFARRGVDVGSTVLWIPLGYYRIDTAEQDDAPYGPIRLSCSDRMAGVIDARLLSPRGFVPDSTVGQVFADLVGEVYPDAVVAFDDSSGSDQLGRHLLAEESRYDLLLDLTRSLGKIMFWDGEGILRVENAPDESAPVWQVKAGRDGVLITAGRRLTRRGIFNAVVAIGEGGDDTNPVRAVAIDNGPNSPTRFGGPFGQVPRFYASPLLTTHVQAVNAATALLRRSLGAPYALDFGAVPNPALKPHDPVRVVYQDGNREIHIMERVTIPLTAKSAMTGTTRARADVLTGELT
jgi:hypothetical protein